MSSESAMEKCRKFVVPAFVSSYNPKWPCVVRRCDTPAAAATNNRASVPIERWEPDSDGSRMSQREILSEDIC